MVSNETWMGAGTSITMAYESELFLGYMPYGPTLGRTGTNKANLVKYSLGYALDGSNVAIENAHGNGTNAVKHFTDYYHLVPDLYTGCIAKFYWTETNGTTPTLQHTAMVAGNDADAIYFAGNLNDYNTLWTDDNSLLDGTGTHKRGYIVLESRGSVIPAPISLEKRNSTVGSELETGDTEITVASGLDGSIENLNVDDLLYTSSGQLIGKIYGFSVDATALTLQDAHSGLSTDNTIHILSGSLGTLAGGSTQANGIGTITVPSDLTGHLTAGDYISNHANTRASVGILGKVITLSDSGLIVTYAQSASATASASDEIYKGRKIATVSATTHIYTVSPKTLSDNWVGLANSITPPSIEMEMKQVNLALGGTRNYSYQYKGMETAGNASLDLNLNHGSWLYYALGSLASVSSTASAQKTHTNNFQTVDSAPANHLVYSGVATDVDDRNSTGHTQNGKFHRVLKGSQAICPPLLPFTSASLITNPSVNANGIGTDLITYTFGERNDNFLPTFALELTNQKGSTLTTTNTPMTDRNTYNESCYSQLFPGCMVNSMTFTANANEEVKTTLDLNVKRVFEVPNGYVAKAFDATNNNTNEMKTLFNFGQQTGKELDVSEQRHSLIEPFYFSDGNISLFGANFMRVESMTLTINNSVTDKRYIGQYNKQIKMAHPAQRTYELTMTAQVTDRRIFDELRRKSPHRVALGLESDGSNSVIELLFTKDNGERIKLQFDDYMISASNWPIPDDRGPVIVDFTIMPLRVSTLDAVSGWVMQK